MDSQDPPKIPKPPKSGQSYGQGVEDYFKYLPLFLGGEQGARSLYDPQRIAEQQQLQKQFGPTQYAQMLDAFKQLDPTYYKAREGFGNTLMNNLNNGTALQNQVGGLTNQLFSQYQQGTPLYNQSVGLTNQLLGQYNTGNTQMADLVKNLQGQYAQGTHLTPDQEREIAQQVRQSQVSRGNASGSSAGIAEAYTQGSRGLQLQQERLQNLMGGLGQQSQIGAQGLQNYLGGAGFQNTLKQQGLSNYLGAAGFQNALGQQNITNMGSFLGQPTMGQQMSFIPPVSADRSFSYINPNAGFQGQQFALQNYQNALGGAALGQQQGGNPWLSAIGALGSIAGPILGGYLSGGGGFSDRRLKTDIKKIGKDERGLNLYSFAYRGPKHIGYMAQEVAKKDPEHVAQDPASGYYMVSQKYAPVLAEAA